MRFHEMEVEVLSTIFMVSDEQAVGLHALFFAAFMAGMRRDNAGIIQEYMREQPEAAIPGALDALMREYEFGCETTVERELEGMVAT